MWLTFITKSKDSRGRNKVFSYKSLGKQCQNAAVGFEMERLHLDDVNLKSEQDVKNLMKVLQVVQAGFVEYKECNPLGVEELRDLIRRTD